MHLRFAFFILLCLPAFAADWVEYRTGPFKVTSNAGDQAARARLSQLEQLRYVLGNLLGKPDLQSVWPIQVILFSNQREYAPHALKSPLMEGGAALYAAWSADVGGKDTNLPRDLIRAVTLSLMEDNAGRMSEDIETAVADLLSTIQVNATRVSIGAPLSSGELTGARLLTWAKLQMLATQPAYTGKLRVYLNNLQNAGDEDTAARNAFDTNAAGLNKQLESYLAAGQFSAAPVSGKPIAPNRDFYEKNLEQPAVDALLADLDAAAKQLFTSESPRGLLAKNTRPSLELAIKANPKWADPHAKLALLEANPSLKIAQWKLAVSLAPRNAAYWKALAEEQAGANLFADAEKSWIAAERAARNTSERGEIHQAKLDLQEQRAQFDIDEKKRIANEAARELQAIKDSARAEIRAAEEAANARLAQNSSPVSAPVRWSETDGAGLRVMGTLAKVECVGEVRRLTVEQPKQAALKFAVHKIEETQDPALQTALACQPDATARQVELQHDGKADKALDTVGNVTAIYVR